MFIMKHRTTNDILSYHIYKANVSTLLYTFFLHTSEIRENFGTFLGQLMVEFLAEELTDVRNCSIG